MSLLRHCRVATEEDEVKSRKSRIFSGSLRSARPCRLLPKGRKNVLEKFIYKSYKLCHTEITEITERLLMDDEFHFIGRTLKTSFQDSSNKIKPLFSARIKQ